MPAVHDQLQQCGSGGAAGLGGGVARGRLAEIELTDQPREVLGAFGEFGRAHTAGTSSSNISVVRISTS